MSTAALPAAPLTREQLTERIRRVDPAAVLVPPRILRRVIRLHRDLPGVALFVPHRRSYLIRRETLLLFVAPQELGVASAAALADRVLLLPEPSPRQARLSTAALLRVYWRLLFHADVHRQLAARRLDPATVADRIDRLGPVEFAEVAAVLGQENYLFDPAGPAEVYEEFAAVYLELRHFDPARLAYFFPGLTDPAAVDALLRADVDADTALAQTRPDGSDDAASPPVPLACEMDETGPTEELAPQRTAEPLGRAAEVARRGNQVRAAILYGKAAQRPAARLEVERLADRLAAALDHPADGAREWAYALAPLLEPAARGVWSREARLLYDLQKVCLDHERPVFAADLVEWIVSGFAQPIRRPLPDLPLVLTVKNLRKAQARLPSVRVGAADRRRLSRLLDAAVAGAVRRLRDTLRPRLVTALDAVDLSPQAAAERLDRDRLVEELLDRLVDRGRLSLPDVRDAMARNRLKLPDLSGPVEFLTGDALIRANRRLTRELDGVYRRGEIYLRWLQRLSSLFFGTRLGRAMTLFAFLPILGSLFVLKGIDGLSEEMHKIAGTAEVTTFSPLSFGVLALVLVPVFNSAAFRRQLGHAARLLWRGFRGVVYDLPAAVLRSEPVQRLLRSPITRQLARNVGKPLLWTLPVFLLLQWLNVGAGWSYGVAAGQMLLMSVLLNTPIGIHVEESVVLTLVHAWTVVGEDLLPGLFRLVDWLSRRFVGRVEKVLYTVDEWLRFRTGESRPTFVLKLLLGLVWFVITYVVRFVIVLLVEPQINPIKHFPVVTVSHKLMLLIVGPLAEILAPELGMSYAATVGLIGSVIWLIPGIFGFLAWELKENWKLYRANQPANLESRVVGSHGERVIHLVRPGFHSGTLPRLFARLRREGGEAKRRDETGLHHIEADVRRFVERGLLAPLALSRRWDNRHRPTVGHITLATNRIGIALHSPAAPNDPLRLEFADRDRQLVAHLPAPGWAAELSPAARDVLQAALTGFFKQAGVDVVLDSDAAALPFGRQPVAWFAWVAYWEADQAGLSAEPLLPSLPSLVRQETR
ncbi:MAG: hypothetical protein U0736_01585 [Gemmataceae bacterium]